MTATQQYPRSVYRQPRPTRPAPPKPPLPPPPTFLTVEEIASRMRVSKMTIYRLIHHGELKANRIGRGFRVTTVAFETYLRSTDTLDGDGA